MKNVRYSSGQSLFEVIFALSIVAIILVSLLSLSAISIANTSFSKNKTRANRYTQEALEWLRGERDASWGNFYTRVVGTSNWCLKTLSWTNPTACTATQFITGSAVFKRDLTFSIVTVNQVVEAAVKVSWSDNKGTHEAKSITRFSSFKNK